MVSRALDMQDVQIAISEVNEFWQDIPKCFQVGNDSRLHHKEDEVNVITKNKMFATANRGTLKVDDEKALSLLKERLLTLPIYMHVRLVREKKVGRTKITQSGNFVVMVNSKQTSFQDQISEKLSKAESLMKDGKKFAIEIKFGKVLKNWYKTWLNHSPGDYFAHDSGFCITNFRRKTKYFSKAVGWVLCLPCFLIAAPIYFTYRKVVCEDSELKIESSVTCVKGTTPEERDEIQDQIRDAYARGMANSGQTPPTEQHAPPPAGFNGSTGYGGGWPNSVPNAPMEHGYNIHGFTDSLQNPPMPQHAQPLAGYGSPAGYSQGLPDSANNPSMQQHAPPFTGYVGPAGYGQGLPESAKNPPMQQHAPPLPGYIGPVGP